MVLQSPLMLLRMLERKAALLRRGKLDVNGTAGWKSCHFFRCQIEPQVKGMPVETEKYLFEQPVGAMHRFAAAGNGKPGGNPFEIIGFYSIQIAGSSFVPDSCVESSAAFF